MTPAFPNYHSETLSVDQNKLNALAEFSAGAGHEINNPLATIIGRVQLLLRDETDPERRRSLTTIGSQAYRIRDMIGDVMLFARPPAPELKAVNLQVSIDTVLRSLETIILASGCSVNVKPSPVGVTILADADQTEIVLSHLLKNSLQASHPDGEMLIQTTAIDFNGRSMGAFSITDFGEGLSELDQQHLFDPFYSGKQAGRGLGFGLSKCWRILQMHGGHIDVQSTPNGPTTVRAYWPLIVED